MLNKVLIIGWLTSDPVVKYLPSGTAVAEFGVAWNRRYRIDDEWKEESHFFDVKAYGRLAEDLSSRLSKGYQVIVEGRLSQDRWTGQDGKNYSRVRIVAESVRIIRKPKLEEVEEEDVSPQDKDPFGDDDIPF